MTDDSAVVAETGHVWRAVGPNAAELWNRCVNCGAAEGSVQGRLPCRAPMTDDSAARALAEADAGYARAAGAVLPEPRVEWAVEVTWADWKKAGAAGPTSQYGPFETAEHRDRFLNGQRRDCAVAATRVFERLASYTAWDSREEPEPTTEADRNARLARLLDEITGAKTADTT